MTCPSVKDKIFDNVVYTKPKPRSPSNVKKSIDVIGLDTESFQDGECYMVCTSLGDVFHSRHIPSFFFSRKYRNKVFVVYNLKYDSGSLLQHLPFKNLDKLRITGKTRHKNIEYEMIGYKKLRVRKVEKKRGGTNGVTIYDIAGFYNMSLDKASEKYLKDRKKEIDIEEITRDNVQEKWEELSKYCIHDAVLTKKLAELQIKSLEQMGLYTRSLISTAYISWQHFRKVCNPPNMNYFYNFHPKVLDYAMRAYNGGKFEVTEKGTGYFYSYDIVSAYPHSIANLPNLYMCKVIYDKAYNDESDFSFLNCKISIPYNVNNPTPEKKKTINIYPVGHLRKVITKIEYDYFIKNGCEIEILDAVHVVSRDKTMIFREEIERLMYYKKKYKKEGNDTMYNTTKVLLNSLYGKFVQLIWKDDKWLAGESWNPLYASYITAYCRTRITELQNKYNSVVAVHTDSIISKEKLSYPKTDILGSMSYETEGQGVLVGSGVYQIGDKVKLRGFDAKINLLEMLDVDSDVLKFNSKKFHSWREIIFRNHSPEEINKVEDVLKEMKINFDHKRLWLDDYTNFREVKERNVYSSPYIYV